MLNTTKASKMPSPRQAQSIAPAVEQRITELAENEYLKKCKAEGLEEPIDTFLLGVERKPNGEIRAVFDALFGYAPDDYWTKAYEVTIRSTTECVITPS